MPGIPIEYYYPLLAAVIFALVCLLIPKAYFRDLFWFGLVWGLTASMLFNLTFGSLLGLIEYVKIGAFHVFRSPIWVNFAWLFSIMLYLHFMPESKKWYVFPLYLLSFTTASMGLDIILHQSGLLLYHGWSPFYRFLISLIWFYGVAVHKKKLVG